MRKADYQQLKRAVEQALRLAEVDRIDFIENALNGQTALIQKAKEMVALEEKTFFKEPNYNPVENFVPPKRFKNYHIKQKIGAGGMSHVFLAEQEMPVERLVAIKFIHTNISQDVLFSECQALARLSHSNIATLHEADTLPDGTLYLVMAYIEGVELNQWLKQFRRSDSEKISLFISICNGINHAHQKGIIHCDIKPSNILVTEAEDDSIVKIIDFGISQLDQPQEQPLYGKGTKGYLAPEYLNDSNSHDIDTRRDVYALGALLHFMLYDRMPETDLQSQRVSSDFDHIIQKATAHDVNQRYESVAALQYDLSLWQQGRPISIRSHDRMYAIGRLIKKNLGAVLFSTALILSLIAGYFAQSRQAVEAQKQADLARQAEKIANEQAEAAKTAEAEAVKTAEFLTDLFDLANPERTGDQDLTAINLVVQAKDRLMGIEEPTLSDARFMHTLGAIFTRMGSIQQASELLHTSLNIKQNHLPDDDAELVDDMIELGIIYRRLGDMGKSKGILNLALEKTHQNPERLKSQQGFVHNHLGNLSWQIKNFKQAIIHHEAAIEVRTKLNQTNLLADSYNNLGVIYREQGQWQNAHKYLYLALDIYLKEYGEQHAFISRVKNNLTLIEEKLFNWEKAEKLQQESLIIAQNIYGFQHPYTIQIARNMAINLGRRYKLDQSITQWQQVIKQYQLINNEFEQINSMGYLAVIYQLNNQFDKAIQLHKESLQAYESSSLVNSVNNLKPRLLMRYAKTLSAVENYEQSLQLLTDANELFLKDYPEDNVIRLDLLSDQGEVYLKQEKWSEAENHFNQVINLAKDNVLHQRQKIDALLGLVKTHMAQANWPLAKLTLQQAEKLSLKIAGEQDPRTAQVWYQMGLLSQSTNQPEQAKKHFHSAFDVQNLALPENHPDLILTQKQIGLK